LLFKLYCQKVKEFKSQAVTFTSEVVVNGLRDITTGHQQELIYSLSKSSNCDDLV